MRTFLKIIIPILFLLIVPNIYLSIIYYRSYTKKMQETEAVNIDQTKQMIDNTVQNIMKRLEDQVQIIMADDDLMDTYMQFILYPDVQMYQRTLIDKIYQKQKDYNVDRLEICSTNSKVIATGSSKLEFNFTISNYLIADPLNDKRIMVLDWYSEKPGRKSKLTLTASVPIKSDDHVYGAVLIGFYLEPWLLENVPKNFEYDILIHMNNKIINSTKKLKTFTNFNQLQGGTGIITIETNSFYYYNHDLFENQLFSTIIVPEQDKHFTLQTIRNQFLLYNTGILLLFGIIVFWTWYSTGHPLSGLTRSLRSFSSGEDYVIKKKNSKDEIAQINNQIKDLLLNQEKQNDKLLQTERMAAWREVARKLAHEIKNPLFPIQVSVETLLKTYSKLPNSKQDKNFKKSLGDTAQMVVDEIGKMTRIVKDFSDYARMSPPVFKIENLNELVKNTINLHAGVKPFIKRTTRFDSQLPLLSLDRDMIQQVLSNIIKNALEAINKKKGVLTISTQYQKEKKEAVITIKDTGPGMDPDTLAKVFLPYFTTKKKGTGLGLAICQRIISYHDGFTYVDSTKGKGTTFKIILPKKDKR